MTKLLAAVSVLLCAWISSADGAAPVLQRPAVEKRLYELDRIRAEADAMKQITKEMFSNLLVLIRLNADKLDEHRASYREVHITTCETEATWRTEFAALEGRLKENNDGSLPVWVTQDRNWQKLDTAMKKRWRRVEAIGVPATRRKAS